MSSGRTDLKTASPGWWGRTIAVLLPSARRANFGNGRRGRKGSRLRTSEIRIDEWRQNTGRLRRLCSLPTPKPRVGCSARASTICEKEDPAPLEAMRALGLYAFRHQRDPLEQLHKE